MAISTYEIMREFDLLPATKQVSVLKVALSYMESFNGRSQAQCICMAMGYRNDTGMNTDWYK